MMQSGQSDEYKRAMKPGIQLEEYKRPQKQDSNAPIRRAKMNGLLIGSTIASLVTYALTSTFKESNFDEELRAASKETKLTRSYDNDTSDFSKKTLKDFIAIEEGQQFRYQGNIAVVINKEEHTDGNASDRGYVFKVFMNNGKGYVKPATIDARGYDMNTTLDKLIQ